MGATLASAEPVVNEIRGDSEFAALAVAARTEPHAYIRMMMGAEGQTIVPHLMHTLMVELMIACREAGQHLVIVGPPEHGKSEQIIHTLLWWVGRDPSIRIGHTCADDDLAKRHLISFRKSILSPFNQLVFPRLQTDKKRSSTSGGWSMEKLYLSGQQHPCLELFPLLGNVEGVRLEVVWLDDVITSICRTSEAERVRRHNAIHGTFLNRLTDNGIAIISNNVWHQQDAIHLASKSPSFTTLWFGYEGFERIYYRVHYPPAGWDLPTKGKLDLWAIWPRERLVKKFHADPSTFKRLYRSNARVDEDMRFPEHGSWSRYKLDELPGPESDSRIVAALDPCGGKNLAKSDFAALAVILIGPDGRLYVVDCWIMRATPEDQIRVCFERHERYRRMGFGGLTRMSVEMLPKDELWMMKPFIAERERRRERGDEHWQLPLAVHHPTEHKNSRIERLGPPLHNGWLLWPENLDDLMAEPSDKGRSWLRLVEQIENWMGLPDETDDAPDALSAAYDVAEKIAAGQRRKREMERERVKRVAEHPPNWLPDDDPLCKVGVEEVKRRMGKVSAARPHNAMERCLR